MNPIKKSGGALSWVFSLFFSFFTLIFLLTDRLLPVTSAEEMLKAMSGAHLGGFCMFLLGTLFYQKLWGLASRRPLGFALAGGAVFTLCDLVGFNIYHHDSLFRPEGNLFSSALELFCGMGAFFLFSGILLLLFTWILQHPVCRKNSEKADRWLGCNLRSFLLYTGVFLLISLPLQVYFYPGITNPDSFTQISEAMGGMALTDRHPFLHTLMMRCVIRLGELLFGTVGNGIAFYTFFQSLLMSLAIAFSLAYMAKRGIHPVIRLLSFLYFALHPAIACYNITLWKDVWLSYFLMLYVLLLIEAVLNPEGFFKGKIHMAGLLLVILGFLFTKNTGIIVLAGTLPFLLICCRKHWKQIALVTVLALSVLGIVRGVVIPQAGIIKGRAIEPLSAPMQQIARTAAREGDSLTQAQKDTINEIMPFDRMDKIYNPALSDDVKYVFRDQAFLSDPGRYAKLWLDLGISHPRAYLESLLANSCGYWYPDVTYWVVDPSWYFTTMLENAEAYEYEDPYEDSYGIQKEDYQRRHYFVHLYELLQMTPAVSTLLSVAISFWAAFTLFLICLMKKKYRMLLPLLVVFITWLVCILSPVIAEYRYAFPAVVSLPLLTAFTLQDDLRLTDSLGLTGK